MDKSELKIESLPEQLITSGRQMRDPRDLWPDVTKLAVLSDAQE